MKQGNDSSLLPSGKIDTLEAYSNADEGAYFLEKVVGRLVVTTLGFFQGAFRRRLPVLAPTAPLQATAALGRVLES